MSVRRIVAARGCPPPPTPNPRRRAQGRLAPEVAKPAARAPGKLVDVQPPKPSAEPANGADIEHRVRPRAIAPPATERMAPSRNARAYQTNTWLASTDDDQGTALARLADSVHGGTVACGTGLLATGDVAVSIAPNRSTRTTLQPSICRSPCMREGVFAETPTASAKDEARAPGTADFRRPHSLDVSGRLPAGVPSGRRLSVAGVERCG